MAGQEKVGVDGKGTHVQELVDAFLLVSTLFFYVLLRQSVCELRVGDVKKEEGEILCHSPTS